MGTAIPEELQYLHLALVDVRFLVLAEFQVILTPIQGMGGLLGQNQGGGHGKGGEKALHGDSYS
jgi:hypothetical protein